MSEKIKIAIAGYGNLGRGVEHSVAQNPDMELVAVFTRRPPETLAVFTKTARVLAMDKLEEMAGKIDVVIMCGGSATDLPVQGPGVSKYFNTIDSFDTHAKIPEYFEKMDKSAKGSGHVSIISVGWDPGLFSLNRLYAESVLVDGNSYTFWGKGVSQGHSDAIRRIDGVKNAIQYTVPVEAALNSVRNGENPQLTTRQKHLRECYVVACEGADEARIEKEIKEMPNYFADYDTTVKFITEKELCERHGKMPHGGFVLRSGTTGKNGENSHIIEYSIKLDSNPEFTSSVLTAYARAAYRLSKSGETGAKTVLDIAPALLSSKTGDELRGRLL